MLDCKHRIIEGRFIADSVESGSVHCPKILQALATLLLVDVEQTRALHLPDKVTLKGRAGHIVSDGDICWSQEQDQAPGKMDPEIGDNIPDTLLIVLGHHSQSGNEVTEEVVTRLQTKVVVPN